MSKTGGSSSAIKSVQYGTVTISSTNNSATATISSVDTSKSFLNFLGAFGASDNFATTTSGAELTNATTVTASRGGSASGGVSVRFVVVEFI